MHAHLSLEVMLTAPLVRYFENVDVSAEEPQKRSLNVSIRNSCQDRREKEARN